jgi:hypothetical protein
MGRGSSSEMGRIKKGSCLLWNARAAGSGRGAGAAWEEASG